MIRLLRLLRWLHPINQIRFEVAARRWEGWGAPGDPRNARAELTWEQWETGVYPPGPLRLR